MTSTRDQFPLRLLINGEDLTFETGEGFTFSNTDPGGYESSSYPIPKDMPNLLRGDKVRLECGLQTAFEGRVKEIDRSLGSKTLIQCQGNRAILKENNLAEVFVDRDLTKWGEASRVRQINELALGRSILGPSVAPDPTSSLPAIVTGMPGPLTPINPLAEAWYDAGPENKIASIYYDYQPGANAQDGGVNWHDLVFLMTDSTGLSGESSANVNGTGTTGTFTGASALRYALLQHYYNGTGGAANILFNAYWRNIAVFGNHGLPKRGSAPQGFYPSDIAGFAASKCPGVQAGVIETASGLIVPHASYRTAVPIDQIINDMAVFAGWHWGVWESLTYLVGSQVPRVDFRAGPQSGEPTAWAWRKECEELDIREDIENMYTSAVVSYSEPSGEEGTVTVSLANPALEKVGLERQANLSFGIGTKESAEAWGLIQLPILADQARMSGSATITEPIHEMNGTAKPAWMLRSGLDRLRIPDLPCPDVWGAHNDLPITRVECSGTASGLVTHVEFGNAVNLLETLAAQLQANTTAVG